MAKKNNETKEEVLKLLSDGRLYSHSAIASLTGIHHYLLKNILEELKEENKIEKHTNKRGTYVYWKSKIITKKQEESKRRKQTLPSEPQNKK